MTWSPNGEQPITIGRLVKATGMPVRLPPSVAELLAQLHRSRSLLGRVTVHGGQEGEQKTADLHLKLARYAYARRSGLQTDHDDLYEALEGAGTARLLIRAHIREIEGPATRFLALDDSELRPTDGLAPDAFTDEEEAWLLTTGEEVLGEYAEEVHEALDTWEEEQGERPRLQNLKLIRGRHGLDLQAIEMPLSCTLRGAQEFAARLNAALGVSLAVQLAPRHAELPRGAGGEYESVTVMARRLRGRT